MVLVNMSDSLVILTKLKLHFYKSVIEAEEEYSTDNQYNKEYIP
jgi:hypothetical protein